MPFINISTYQFTPLTDLKSLRERLITLCRRWELKGTILLSSEGINLFVAGTQASIDLLLAELRGLPGLSGLTPKLSESDHQPFRRMLVRIKKEIISFGVEGINPGLRTSPKLAPATLKQWLDEGRPITLLDTRNDYEVRLGTFKNAVVPHIDTFRQFPEAVSRLPEEMKEQPIVMFCTGGIRCEKAGPYMEREGFKTIYQLDGGILKYFEECGSAHYDGECFVFDQRVGVDPSLSESETTQCYVCRASLSLNDQKSPKYVVGKSCPSCFKDPQEIMSDTLKKRQARLREISSPLPGSVPYQNFRPLTVATDYHGKTLMEFLTGCFSHHPAEKWMALFERGELLDWNKQPARPGQIVKAGERFQQSLPQNVEPAVNADIQFLHEDEAIIVLTKPAPLPMHPGGRFNRNTLSYLLNEIYTAHPPRPVHRLDANTSGVLVMTRSRHFAKLLQPQFVDGRLEKTYLAKVNGHPAKDHFICDAPISDVPQKFGARSIAEDGEVGQPCLTEFSVVTRNADGTALLEARPKTGRTNQIRLHLHHLGHSICGDATYRPALQDGEAQTLSVEDPPMCLHAWKLAFEHPRTRFHMEFAADPPDWAAR